MYTIIALACCLLTGVMVRFQGITALLWVPVGLVFGLFVSAQQILPIIMGLPRAIRLVHNRQMRPAVFGRIILTPVIWFVLLFAAGFFWPKAAEYLYNNISFNLGTWLGTIAIILTPLSKKGRSDFREDFDRAYQRFYTEDVPTAHQESENRKFAAEIEETEMKTDEEYSPPQPSKQNVINVVLKDAIANTLYFIFGTVAIVLIGSWSRRFGIVLAVIGAVSAVVQSLKVLFIIVVDVTMFVTKRFTKLRIDYDDETEMRWATLIRIIELGVWICCLFVLYRFFFGHA
jgi:hypothetical protein